MTETKCLNLFAGLGGNRKDWPLDCRVTAVELNPKIAAFYQKEFPKDDVIIADAHQFLIDHYAEFDFIWSSPPCQTHTRFNYLKYSIPQYKKKYPDMTLYQEIIFLTQFFKGKFCVENVISYYAPLIKPQQAANHYFWSNFSIPSIKKTPRDIQSKNGISKKMKRVPFILGPEFTQREKLQFLNNCVTPKIGRYVFDCAFKLKQKLLCED